MTSDRRLLCYLVRDVDAPVTHSIVDSCCTCRRMVWRSLSSPPKPLAICKDCTVQAAAAGELITVLPLTPRQRAAIRKNFADR
jgi:hypothetical protein